jgi:hypothetical protein
MADDPNQANIKARLEADQKIVEESNRQYAERAQGKPTPTQAENDRAKLGEHILEHEDDGSGPDVHAEKWAGRTVEAKKPGTYQTRQATAAAPHDTRATTRRE